MFTLGSAWFSGEESVKGGIAPGPYADLAVSDCTLSTTPSVLKRAHARLKPARPNRRDADDPHVIIQASAGIVVVHLRTASAQFEAVTSRSFQVSMPLSLFDQISQDHLKGRQALMWSFGNGWVKDGGVTISGVAVEVRVDGGSISESLPSSRSARPALEQMFKNSPIHADIVLEGAPLGKIYAHFRAAPSGTTPGTRALIAKYAEAMGKVDRAVGALECLGVSRAELDDFIYRRFGPPSPR